MDINNKKSNISNSETSIDIIEKSLEIKENSTVMNMETISEYNDSNATNDLFSQNKKLKIKDLKQKSVLYIIIKSLITYWPPSYAANTPKEVLMLHELEALVAQAADSIVMMEVILYIYVYIYIFIYIRI
jgi:hypothetical protein